MNIKVKWWIAIRETITVNNVIVLIKSVFNKNYNHYYWEMFYEKC